MRKIIIFIFFTLFSLNTLIAQEKIVKEINIMGSKLSNDYIMRHLTFQVGDYLNNIELDKAINIARIKAQADTNIDLFDAEYFEEDNGWYVDIYISDPTFKLTFGNFFDPISTGTFIQYKNLLGEGGDLGAYLGYDRQMLYLAWNYIPGTRLGISSRLGHKFFNPLIPDKQTSAWGATSRLYFLPGPAANIKIGLVSDIYEIIGDKKDISSSIGFFYDNNLDYLLDVIGVGFKSRFSYRFFPTDKNSNVHRIDAGKRIIIRPFNTDIFMAVLDGNLSVASDKLYETARLLFSKSSGKASWQAGMSLPIAFKKFRGDSLNLLIGLEPGITVGQAGDTLSANNVEITVTLAPLFHVGHPVSLVFIPRFGYNITHKSLGFSFLLRPLPYTTEIDKGW